MIYTSEVHDRHSTETVVGVSNTEEHRDETAEMNEDIGVDTQLPSNERALRYQNRSSKRPIFGKHGNVFFVEYFI